MTEEYLGDGLYASWDGTYIILRTEREHGVTHWVGLEPPVYNRLQMYADKVYAGKVVPIDRGPVQIVEVKGFGEDDLQESKE